MIWGILMKRDTYISSGRENNMILYGGMNIFPEEIETLLSLHPEVEKVAVLGLTNSYWGQM